MKLFILVIAILIILFLISTYKFVETFENAQEQSYLKDEQRYFQARQNSLLPVDEAAEKFYKFDTTQPMGKQLEIVEPTSVTMKESNVDEQVQRCSNLTSCSQLDGTNCGYCFSNNRFYYGNDKGPLTDVCEKGWVRTGKDCQEYRERAICAKVTNCHEMVGEASICAWCPTKNIAMPYIEQNGILVPKYPDKDKCNDEDITSGKQLGLVKQGDCDQFYKDHPCIGPNEDKGPHSDACLQHLWKQSGCQVQGTHNPDKNQTQKNWWNQRGWKAVFSDMKAWFSDANSSNWSLAKSHHEGCYGTNPDPCDPKYNGPLECYQKKFTQAGCSQKGSAYPTTKPTTPISKYTQTITNLKNTSHNNNIPFNERNDAYNKCYGGHLTAPPPPKVGDYVVYEFNSSKWGPSAKIYGYICVVDGKTAKVFWEEVINQKGNYHITRSAHLNSPKTLEQFLGLYCGMKPSFFPEVPATPSLSDLKIVKACDANTSCNETNCALQSIVYIHYPNTGYSVSKTQVSDVLSKAVDVIPSTTLCTENDIQNLVNFGIPNCACGWINKNDGTLTSVYPSTSTTGSGCGSGEVKVVNCGDNGPSWSGGKAGVYVLMNENPDTIPSKLAKGGLSGNIVATVGKNEYMGLLESVAPQIKLGYIGCFDDKPSRAMPTYLGVMTYEQAMKVGKEKGFKYIGLQDATAFGLNKAQVFASNSDDYDKYGKKSCIKLHSGQAAGGPWANAVYRLK